MEDLPKLDKQEGVPKLYRCLRSDPSKNQKPLVKEILSKTSIGDHCRRKEVEVDIEGLGLTKVTKIETCNVLYGLLLLLILRLG